MKKIDVLLLGSLLFILSTPLLHAQQPLLFEGFESYVSGTNTGAIGLDANGGGPNSGPNGGPGNAWWGQFPTDLRVVRAETLAQDGFTNSVAPHGGTNMVRGAGSGFVDFDQNFYNIAYRLNQSNIFTGNVVMDWWFYDPAGTNLAGASQYQDNISLASYTGMPTNSDYVASANPDPGFALAALSLGASSSLATGYHATNYQAQVLGTGNTNAYDTNTGWFNLAAVRSVGWHHAKIAVAPSLPNGTANVSFYIDDMSNPQLTNNAAVTNGFNCIVMTAESSGSLTGYFDDLTFDNGPRPVLNIGVTNGNAIVTWAVSGWTLQTSTNLNGTNFTDVPGATSPYTNATTGTPQFYRLRF